MNPGPTTKEREMEVLKTFIVNNSKYKQMDTLHYCINGKWFLTYQILANSWETDTTEITIGEANKLIQYTLNKGLTQKGETGEN